MINKQLETNINSHKILEKLSENLGIDSVTDGSSLKKLADVYTNDALSLVTELDSAIGNGFISTMNQSFLNMFGRERGLSRKVFSSINLEKSRMVFSIKVDLNYTSLSQITEPLKIYNKGDIILVTDNFLIEVMEDVFIEDLNKEVYATVKVSLQYGITSVVINEETTLATTSTISEVKDVISNFILTFHRTVGLAMLQEDVEDYRLRIMEEEYRANNGANSLLASVVKEVPFISYMELDNYSEGHAVKVIYPYTKKLTETGRDITIDEIIKPLIISNIQGRVLYGSKIKVETPEPLMLNVEVYLKKDAEVTEAYFYNITKSFNRSNVQGKKLSYEMIDNSLKEYLRYYKNSILKIKYIFTSPLVSEETFELGIDSIDIHIPNGRFLYLNQIRGIKTDD